MKNIIYKNIERHHENKVVLVLGLLIIVVFVIPVMMGPLDRGCMNCKIVNMQLKSKFSEGKEIGKYPWSVPYGNREITLDGFSCKLTWSFGIDNRPGGIEDLDLDVFVVGACDEVRSGAIEATKT